MTPATASITALVCMRPPRPLFKELILHPVPAGGTATRMYPDDYDRRHAGHHSAGRACPVTGSGLELEALSRSGRDCPCRVREPLPASRKMPRGRRTVSCNHSDECEEPVLLRPE